VVLISQFPFIVKRRNLAIDLPALVDLIAHTQLESGEIPWSSGDKTDPWDHVESAMGLAVGGRLALARKAFKWLKDRQLSDGSWFAAYKRGKVQDRTRETNHAAYIAVGVYHYYLIAGDLGFVRCMWSTIEAAIDFTLDQQTPSGEIYWALNPEGQPDPMALLAGCSSISFSLKCALALGKLMGVSRPRWHASLLRLQDCIRHQPHRYNMAKSRFSMDWFYPILCGAITGSDAHRRIDRFWKKFVIQGTGVRCVSDRPWVTIAESSELVLALAAMDNILLARIVFSWISDRTFEDGTYWCGFTFPDMVLWPEEKVTWTNAVVLMAADALYNLTPASNMFSHKYWNDIKLL
jgi:hypothetical protein